MADFIKIPREFLAEIATGSERIPSLYYHKHWLIREFFWLRLRFVYRYLHKHAEKRGTCLDFGCGSGVFLPTLAGLFDKVVCIDLETAEAKEGGQAIQPRQCRAGAKGHPGGGIPGAGI